VSKKIIRIGELSEILEISQNSIRCSLKRGNDAVPKPIKLGRRIAWTVRQIEDFLERKEKEAAEGQCVAGQKTVRKKAGRPSKKQQVEGR